MGKTTENFNPRYAAYANAHSHTVESMLAKDRERYPGGAMVGFLLWNREHLRRFRDVFPEAFLSSGLRDHAAYDSWLAENAEFLPWTTAYLRSMTEPEGEVFV